MTLMRFKDALHFTTDEERERSFLITDPREDDNPIVFVNEAFLKLTVYTLDEVIGRNCRFLQGAETNPLTVTALREAIQARKRIIVDILNYKKDGSAFWNRLSLRPVFESDGSLRSFVGVQQAIREDEASETPQISSVPKRS
jgi:PAS domain S-box-containing protein